MWYVSFLAVAERDTWHVCGARCRVGSVTSAGVRLRINRVWFSGPQGPSLPGSLCKEEEHDVIAARRDQTMPVR